jgi:hypothetical protein
MITAPKGYAWIVEGDLNLLNTWLPCLAHVGRSLYRQLLPQNQRLAPQEDPGDKLQARLTPDMVIQVNPVLGRVTLPWALLYEREIKYVPNRTRVCEEFAQHAFNCAGCSHVADPYTVCPNAFWGYRYAIEQLPCWTTGEIPHPGPLIQCINNNCPLYLNFNVYPTFQLWQNHIQKLKSVGQVTLIKAEKIADLDNVWSVDNNGKWGLVYFYVHGGLDTELQEPYLALGDGHITSNFLEACNLKWSRKPLVFLNGCATGDYGPESYISLIDDFRQAGACGVVGTECSVPELFAEAYAAALLPQLFRGEQLGKAMLDVRRRFLTDKLNPLGLVYSLYATHEIALARPVA